MNEVELGSTKYSVSEDGNPDQVGGIDRFVVVSADDGKPLLQHRPNGQTFHVTYKTKRGAEATARAIAAAGLDARVHTKEDL